MSQSKTEKLLKKHQANLDTLLVGQGDTLQRLSERLVERFNHGNKLLVTGQGVLNNIADLIAVMFMHRLNFDRPALPALALGNNLAMVQSLERFAAPGDAAERQLVCLAQPGDFLLMLADPKQNNTLPTLAATAQQKGCVVALICNNPDDWRDIDSDLLLTLPAESAAELMAPMLFCGQVLCELVEQTLFGV